MILLLCLNIIPFLFFGFRSILLFIIPIVKSKRLKELTRRILKFWIGFIILKVKLFVELLKVKLQDNLCRKRNNFKLKIIKKYQVILN